jgi:glutamine synthetase
MNIVSEAELKSRYHILMEKYAKDLLIEANTLKNMVFQGVLPSAFAYRKDLADSLAAMKSVGVDVSQSAEKPILDELTVQTSELRVSAQKLVQVIDRIHGLEGDEQAEAAGKELPPLLDEVRVKSDAVEAKTGDKFWSYPKYTELLF